VTVVIAISIDHTDRKEISIVATDTSRLNQYCQVQSIFIVSPTTTKEINSDTENNSSTNVRKDTDKVIEIFHNHQSMFVRLQQLISETEEFDDGLFNACNRREKALRVVRQELSAFVWSWFHSLSIALTTWIIVTLGTFINSFCLSPSMGQDGKFTFLTICFDIHFQSCFTKVKSCFSPTQIFYSYSKNAIWIKIKHESTVIGDRYRLWDSKNIENSCKKKRRNQTDLCLEG
jgi:hypothetical protein